MRPVVVTQIRKELGRLTAVVEYDERRERWPLSPEDARNIAKQFRGDLDVQALVPGGRAQTTIPQEPVLIELPEPPQADIEVLRRNPSDHPLD